MVRIQTLSNASLFISLFFLTRQFPFKEFSPFISIGIVVAFALNYRQIWRNLRRITLTSQRILILFLGFMVAHFFISLVLGSTIPNALRTLAALFLLILAYYYPPNKVIIDIFFFLTLLHAFILVSVEIYMKLNFSGIGSEFYVEMRKWIQSGYGDLFTFDGIYFRFVTFGNDLLPFSFMSSFFYFKSVYKRLIFCSLLFCGILVSGNLAFFIIIGAFLVIYSLIKFKSRSIILFSIILIIFAFNYSKIQNLISSTLEQKNTSSLPTRYDQAFVLLNDLSENILFFVGGRGMGHLVNEKTEFRDYRHMIYYEIQALYWLNQLGFLSFLILVYLLFILALKFIDHKSILLVYGAYILYGSTNPYILSTGHIHVILVCISLANELNKNRKFYIVPQNHEHAIA